MSLANVKGWQTDLKTGLVVPGTTFEDHNTIQGTLRNYLAYLIGTNPALDSTNERALDDLFTTDGTPSFPTHQNEDGIVHGGALDDIQEVLATSLSVGGDNTVNYIEFYGYIDGAATLDENLMLVHDFFALSPNEAAYMFAEYDINTSVSAGRRFHFYWRITIIGALQFS